MIGRLMNVKFKCSYGSKKETLVNWNNVIHANQVLPEYDSMPSHRDKEQTEITFVNGRVLSVNHSLDEVARITNARLIND